MPLADATKSVALLGPTNTGKTHRAIERMLEHSSGMIGLPLRLLAREVYDRVSARIGQERVALVTGEEKRVPRRPHYWVCTTEAMPLGREVDFVAVDEIQLATHDERGHVFTDRLLHARGRRESWFLGSHSMAGIVEKLVPAARHERHPRLSRLSFAGATPITRLPPLSAVIAFSIPELYAVAGRLRALRGGAAVVLGALSPRTRNAQVSMFQAGEVDYLVATDAIGMGLNLELDHVAFASLRKFDGRSARSLDSAELAQIAGRAGRYLRDGSFGTLSPVTLSPDLAALVEQHRFEPVRRVRYRNRELDFASATALLASLQEAPPRACLARIPDAVDLRALRALLADREIARLCRARERLALLWAVCEIPDYRQILFEVHVQLLRGIYLELVERPLSDDFLSERTRDLDDPAGDVDALLARIARLRTWAYVVHRAEWAADPEPWRDELGRIESRLSDALHAGLVKSFVEQQSRARVRPRARAASRALPASSALETAVDRHHPFAELMRLYGRLEAPLTPERASDHWQRLCDAPHEAFSLDEHGDIHEGGLKLASLVRGSSLKLPDVRLADLAELAPGTRLRLERRLLAFARDSVTRALGPIPGLHGSEHASVRAVAYALEAHLGSASATELEASLAAMSEAGRGELVQSQIVIGRLALYVPDLLKPAALARRATLLRIRSPGLRIPELGRPQFEAAPLAAPDWLSLGYLVLGSRACRIDLVERAAAELGDRPAPEALRCLSLPRRDVTRVARAITARAEAPG